MKYYVTYFYKKGYETGYGGFFATVDKPIKTQTDISGIREYIEEEYNIETAVVLDYKLLEENENE